LSYILLGKKHGKKTLVVIIWCNVLKNLWQKQKKLSKGLAITFDRRSSQAITFDRRSSQEYLTDCLTMNAYQTFSLEVSII